jgi:RNA polymerase sigma-70 factor (ECF subfamily)
MRLTELTDEKIMLRVKEGHLEDLGELFNRYHVQLYNFFLKLTFDRDASEDMTQTLFYRLIKYRQTFRFGDGSFRSWVYQIARNIHVDFYKEQSRFRVKQVDDFEDHPAETGTYSDEAMEKLDRSLLQLTPAQREIILLSRYQGMKYEEISQVLNMSVAAIKVQVHRAIKQLRGIYFQQQ